MIALKCFLFVSRPMAAPARSASVTGGAAAVGEVHHYDDSVGVSCSSGYMLDDITEVTAAADDHIEEENKKSSQYQTAASQQQQQSLLCRHESGSSSRVSSSVETSQSNASLTSVTISPPPPLTTERSTDTAAEVDNTDSNNNSLSAPTVEKNNNYTISSSCGTHKPNKPHHWIYIVNDTSMSIMCFYVALKSSNKNLILFLILEKIGKNICFYALTILVVIFTPYWTSIIFFVKMCMMVAISLLQSCLIELFYAQSCRWGK